jgi:WD40 repeat protein
LNDEDSSDKVSQVRKARLTFSGHTNAVLRCAISPDNSFIVSASNDQTLKVWETLTGLERFTLTGHTKHINSCAISSDSSLILSVAANDSLKVWEVESGTCLATLQIDGWLYDYAWFPDDRHIVGVGSGGIYYRQLVQ